VWLLCVVEVHPINITGRLNLVALHLAVMRLPHLISFQFHFFIYFKISLHINFDFLLRLFLDRHWWHHTVNAINSNCLITKHNFIIFIVNIIFLNLVAWLECEGIHPLILMDLISLVLNLLFIKALFQLCLFWLIFYFKLILIDFTVLIVKVFIEPYFYLNLIILVVNNLITFLRIFFHIKTMLLILNFFRFFLKCLHWSC